MCGTIAMLPTGTNARSAAPGHVFPQGAALACAGHVDQLSAGKVRDDVAAAAVAFDAVDIAERLRGDERLRLRLQVEREQMPGDLGAEIRLRAFPSPRR